MRKGLIGLLGVAFVLVCLRLPPLHAAFPGAQRRRSPIDYRSRDVSDDICGRCEPDVAPGGRRDHG